GSPNERDPGALMLVTLARLGEDKRVRPVGVRDQRRRFARERGLTLATGDVRVAARRGDLVVVPLERAVTREGVVVRVRGDLVDLERRRPRAATVSGRLVVGIDRGRVERALARFVPCAIGDV